jgi:peptide/nickel transport system substrate-binding protein
LSEELDRRAFLRRSGYAVAALGAVGVPGFLAACGKSSGKASASNTTAKAGAKSGRPITTLRMPFLADMQVPDPDIFYEAEGLMVTLSVYENLVRYTPVASGTPLKYEPVSKRISPGLATSWEVSPDQLTYTFHLRPNVKFHDGTPMDAESWRKGFDRRLAVNQGPAYQVTPVASTAAPDPLTFVVTLKHPVDPFLDYMACPWAPKAVSPTAVAAHTVNGDLAQKWLTTNDAGTGPYEIKEFVASNHYTLEAFPGYWGAQPEVKTVIISIIPDPQTQELKFKSGDLDLITKGLPIQDIQAFEKDPNYSVSKFQTALCTSFFMNNTKGRIFENKELRTAVKGVVDKKSLVASVYKDKATVATQFFPGGCYPDGLVADNPKPDPAALAKLVKGLPSKKVDIAYGEEGGATNRLMAQLLQTELQAAGLQVTVRGIPTSQEFALYNTPDNQRPDILLDLFGGDTLHVDTMLRIVFRTGAAPLNWFTFTFPQADALMDQAWAATDQDQVAKLYTQSAQVVRDEAVLVNIANQYDVIVTRAGINNVTHDPMALQGIRLADLKSA